MAPACDAEAVEGSVSSGGSIRLSVPVPLREIPQFTGDTCVTLADHVLRSSVASHAPDGQSGLQPPPTGVEHGGSG